ncbi:hypothetical protein [Jiangella alkaliphila]|uniref:Small integral membrane protein n=1 Tax=Jiangella alkaliphila TaxID=419479 RepID=A0A1H2L780_9ACTN|nr:hypothetical protein [Jiangella alkaliphila]SDU76853.1 hypothetical protein SAMN04488563_5338 [Jiangella alkaliphila]
MNATGIGLVAGLLLALAATTGGLGGFLLAIVLGLAGLAVAGHLSGELDVRALWRGRERD